MHSVSAITEEVTNSTSVLYDNIEAINEISSNVSDNTLEVSEAAREQSNMMKCVINEVKELTVLSNELKDGLSVFVIDHNE